MTALPRRLVCGTAGALMVVALLLPWAQVQAADHAASPRPGAVSGSRSSFRRGGLPPAARSAVVSATSRRARRSRSSVSRYQK